MSEHMRIGRVCPARRVVGKDAEVLRRRRLADAATHRSADGLSLLLRRAARRADPNSEPKGGGGSTWPAFGRYGCRKPTPPPIGPALQRQRATLLRERARVEDRLKVVDGLIRSVARRGPAGLSAVA